MGMLHDHICNCYQYSIHLNHFRIGFAIAERFANEGAKVVISSRKPENVTKAVDKLKSDGHKSVIGVKCHVSNADDRKQLFDAAVKNFGKIDILVSNAAVNPTVGSVLDCSEEAWDKIFDVNVRSSFLLAKEVAPFLRKQSSGNIIFMSSYGGINPFPVSTNSFDRISFTKVKMTWFINIS